VTGRFELLVPAELLAELAARVDSKPYLANRIWRKDLDELVAILDAVGEVVPRLERPAPRVTRDAKDDYLLAHAVLAGADYLVTGDADLLELEAMEGLRIVTAAELVAVLGSDNPDAGESGEEESPWLASPG
jgi:putative PIN family toxin of toxin-antitoxin system